MVDEVYVTCNIVSHKSDGGAEDNFTELGEASFLDAL